jgi:hypothetical protein
MKRNTLIGFILILLIAFSTGCRSVVECTKYTADDAQWADDILSPDYHHIDASYSDEPFYFSTSDFKTLLAVNSFPISEEQDHILFGLRGCQVSDREGIYSETVQLQETKPDHINYQDVLGIWQQSTGQMVIYEGSTVPNWYYMCIQAEIGGHQANLLPTGKYSYSVGRHRDINGAFRSEQEVVVLRSNDNMSYEITDDWEIWVPYDNIHPGGCPDKMYSSAGCQTIPGTFGKGCEGFYPEEVDTHLGPWGEFRASVGLDPNNNQDLWEEPFTYILLTCREARLVSQGDSESLQRLRFGSEGESVIKLQNALLSLGYNPGAADGVMGPNTVFALIQWQQSQFNGQADGIFTPEVADILGVELE